MAQKPAPKIAERKTTVNGNEYTGWMLVYYDASGKRVRKSYPTRAKAEHALREWLDKDRSDDEARAKLRKKIGQKADKLTVDDLLDATRALELLRGAGRLEDAARFYLRHNNPQGGMRTIAQVRDEYIEEARQDGLRPESIYDMDIRLRRFVGPFGGRMIATITREEVTQWLRGKHTARKDGTPCSPLSRRHFQTVLGGMFNFAIENGYVAENPVTKRSRRRRKQSGLADERMPEVLTAAEVGAIMAAAEEFEPSMVAPLAIGFFAGVRTNELGRLCWRDVDLKARRITIAPSVAKKRSVRHIEIADNLAAWLAPFVLKAGPMAPRGPTWRYRLEKVRKNAKVEHWPHNAMRHSFATYFLLKTNDANMTALQLGHRDTELLFRHYRGISTPEEAELFWNIVPFASEGGALQFTMAS
jgi:integrase